MYTVLQCPCMHALARHALMCKGMCTCVNVFVFACLCICIVFCVFCACTCLCLHCLKCGYDEGTTKWCVFFVYVCLYI